MESEEDQIPEPTDSIQIHVGSDEKMGAECDGEGHDEDSPKDSLTYTEAVVKLHARLWTEVCPTPQSKSKPCGASALDFFKDQVKEVDVSLALPQSNSILVSLIAMNKHLRGDEEIPMSP